MSNKKKLFNFKKIKLPWLYIKALMLFEKTEKKELTKKDLTQLFNKKFRLGKKDVKRLIKELTFLGVLERVNKRKFKPKLQKE